MTSLKYDVLTTDPAQQPPEEWWDIAISTIWAEETLKRYPLRYAAIKPHWQTLMAMMIEGDRFRRFTAPGHWSGMIHSGLVLVRDGKAIATLALSKVSAADEITFTPNLPHRTWLGEKVSEKAALADLIPIYDENLLAKWRAMQSIRQRDDEIRWFSNSPQAWAELCGCCGLALVRNGEPVACITTGMN